MRLAVDAPFDGDGTQQMQSEETSFADFAGYLKQATMTQRLNCWNASPVAYGQSRLAELE